MKQRVPDQEETKADLREVVVKDCQACKLNNLFNLCGSQYIEEVDKGCLMIRMDVSA